MVAKRLEGGENRELVPMGTEFQFGTMKNFWRWMIVMVA